MSHKSLEILMNASFWSGMKVLKSLLRLLAKKKISSGKLLFIEGIARFLKSFL